MPFPVNDEDWQKRWSFKFAGKTIVLSARPLTVPKEKKCPSAKHSYPNSTKR
jgi:hypothetical protein